MLQLELREAFCICTTFVEYLG